MTEREEVKREAGRNRRGREGGKEMDVERG